MLYNIYAIREKNTGVYRISPSFYEKSEPPGSVEHRMRGGNH